MLETRSTHELRRVPAPPGCRAHRSAGRAAERSRVPPRVLWLPFVVFKANRIVPGRSAGTVRGAAGIGWRAALRGWLLVAALAGGAGGQRARPAAGVALAGLVDRLYSRWRPPASALTPPGNQVVRVAAGAGFWVLLVCLGLMAPMRSRDCGPPRHGGCCSCSLFLARRGAGAGFRLLSISSRSCASTR